MANITNRSPWEVSCPGQETKKFRLKSQAQTYLDGLKNKRAKMEQLQTSFEVQIKLKDRDGNIATSSGTFPSMKFAEQWAKEEEDRLLSHRQENGTLEENPVGLDINLAAALTRTLDEHYAGKEAQGRLRYVAKRIVGYFKVVRLAEVDGKSLKRYRDHLLKEEKLAPSTVRNYFSLISQTFEHIRKEWHLDIPNYARLVVLPEADNAKERNWESGDEKTRLFEAINKRSPWLMPLVEMSLEMSFRRGELVPINHKKAESPTFKGGMRWEGIDFTKRTVRLFEEKNDHTKKKTEIKGRTVPMTPRMYEILKEEYDKSTTKKGLVFSATGNSVSQAFKECCKIAEPPIENLTFHSCRKIATYELSKIVPDPIRLSRFTGHKDIRTLSDRYYKMPVEDMQLIINAHAIDDPVQRGLVILQTAMGEDKTREFLMKVMSTEMKAGVDVLKMF